MLALINDRDNPLSEDDIMNKEELDNAINGAKPIKKVKIECKAEKIFADRIRNLIATTEEIANRKVALKVLTELKDYQRLSDWLLLKLEEQDEYMNTSLYYDELKTQNEKNNREYSSSIKPYNDLISEEYRYTS